MVTGVATTTVTGVDDGVKPMPQVVDSVGASGVVGGKQVVSEIGMDTVDDTTNMDDTAV